MESDNDSDIGDMLNDLLANSEPAEPPAPEPIKESNFNFLESQGNIPSPTKEKNRLKDNGEISLVHVKDVNSSDDEDARNFESQNYSSYGRNLKNLLKEKQTENPKEFDRRSFEKLPEKSPGTFDFNVEKKIANIPKTASNIYNDPIFGLGLTKPLISSTELVERMRGRKAVTVSRIKSHIATENLNDDWVIAGVVISRSTTKTSAKGSQYCIWKLSDLGENMNTVSLFLFSGSYKTFWKTTTGTVVGILNPNILESKDDIDQATLSVDNPQKVMILGNSRDMAKCKSTKKNGEPCSNIVNLSRCEYCVYHVKREYNKASRRPDIQSNASGRGFSSSLKPKEKLPPVGIYSQGGKNFTPIPAKRNVKQYEKDSARLALLKGTTQLPEKIENKCATGDETTRKACLVELTTHQVKKDLERLNKLRGWNVGKQMSFESSPEVLGKTSPIQSSENSTMSTILNSSLRPTSLSNIPKTPPAPSINIPRIGLGVRGGSIDLSEPITKRQITNARMNAERWARQNAGALKPSNPNKIRESATKIQKASAKRQREAEQIDAENTNRLKKTNCGMEKFKEMLSAKSAHVDLVEKSQDEEKEKYFNKLEMKERMEEKMMTTFKIDCKAVRCLICKYTAFSGSDFCKQQQHPLRVINAVKSFFKCADCGNRTVSLDRIPSISCNKCSGSHWVRAGMMSEKKTQLDGAKLSIRGGEEKFIGGGSRDANLNLLVPDSETA